ncbi:hypothetical protein CEXT_286041 [Caerostris extrusa]|uniref:Uncharacterized protein n=1 Tax=Caerostris extrusa TaxID=172846 RepID=A0AAV4MFH4_CAEEX|nr:hypothetical protein CEXT_286041 [Caerostris extrusa]
MPITLLRKSMTAPSHSKLLQQQEQFEAEFSRKPAVQVKQICNNHTQNPNVLSIAPAEVCWDYVCLSQIPNRFAGVITISVLLGRNISL